MSFATITPPNADGLVHAVFGQAYSFVRGWAPKSAGIDPYSGFAGHSGIDLSAPKGTPVYALASGIVNFAGSEYASPAQAVHLGLNGGGTSVSIATGAGVNQQYAHLADVTVRQGQSVQAGQLIGHVGSTGISTGPHLLFSIREKGAAIDPVPFLAGLAGTGRPATPATITPPTGIAAKVAAGLPAGEHPNPWAPLVAYGLPAVGLLLLLVLVYTWE